MIRRMLPGVLTAVMLLLDLTILPVFVTSDYLPVFTLVLTHCLGLLLGRSRGALYGMIAGLLIDISVSTPLGLMTFIFTGMGYLGGWFMRRNDRNPLLTVLSSAIGFVAAELILTFYVIFASGQISAALFGDAGLRVLIDMLAVQAFLRPLDWLLKPSHSRYAAK